MGKLVDPTASVVLLSITGGIVCILNGFALYVFLSQKKYKRVSNIPLVWTHLANLLIGMFPLPFYGLKKFEFEDEALASRICDGWRYTYFACIHLALSSLLLMTLQKIFILKFPLRYRQVLNKFRTNTLYVLAWIFLIIFDMIPFFPLDSKDKDSCHYKVRKEWALAMNILTAAVPLPLIICCYCYMLYLAYVQTIRIQRESTVSRNNGDNGKTKKRKIRVLAEVKATKKVTLIVGAYIICWTPSTLYYLLEWLCPECYPDNYEPHRTWIRFFFKFLVMLHAFVTPIIFCCQNREFRKDARKSVYGASKSIHDSSS